jgi:hypothetical protein
MTVAPDDLQQCQSMQQEEFEVLEVWCLYQLIALLIYVCIGYLSRIHFYAELGRSY